MGRQQEPYHRRPLALHVADLSWIPYTQYGPKSVRSDSRA